MPQHYQETARAEVRRVPERETTSHFYPKRFMTAAAPIALS